MKHDWFLFVLCCMGLAGVGCFIAAEFMEDFETVIYLDLMGIMWVLFMDITLGLRIDEKRRTSLATHDQYIAKLMEQVQDLHLGIDECLVEIRELERRTDVLEKSQKKENP